MSYISPISGVTTYPLLATNGMIMSNSTTDLTNDISFTPGYCTDDTYTKIITAYEIIKQLDSTFSEGNNAGMLINSTAKQNSATYYIYSIGKNSNASSFDYVASTALLTSSTQLPTGWDLKRQIRAIKTDQNGVAWIIKNRNDDSYGPKVIENYQNDYYGISANDQHFFQFYIANEITINRAKAVIQSGTTGKRVIYSIYSDNGNSPNSLLSRSQEITLQAGDIDTNSNEIILSFRNPLTLSSDTRYWFSIYSDGTMNWYKGIAWAGRYKLKTRAYDSTCPASVSSLSAATNYAGFQLF